jgi:hypothetical protein
MWNKSEHVNKATFRYYLKSVKKWGGVSLNYFRSHPLIFMRFLKLSNLPIVTQLHLVSLNNNQ